MFTMYWVVFLASVDPYSFPSFYGNGSKFSE